MFFWCIYQILFVNALLSQNNYEEFKLPQKNPNKPLVYPLVLPEIIVDEQTSVPVRIAIIQNPSYSAESFSVYEPGGDGGCSGGDKRARTTDTAELHHCIAAANAGFFNPSNGDCLGNIISDQKIVQTISDNIKKNVNFGIKKDGTIITGYLDKADVSNKENPYLNLVGGVIWMVRNGTNYVEDSEKVENMDTQTTGPEFSSIVSARTAIGHDSDGRIILVQVEGKSRVRGFSLPYFANFLIGIGLINAINLDGGGSSTMVLNGSLLNIPSDTCPEGLPYVCERKVTTIACFHEPIYPCDDSECGHGKCGPFGICVCDPQWTSDNCSIPVEIIPCLSNCSDHGDCQIDGTCQCYEPWIGDLCEEQFTKEIGDDSIVLSKKLLFFILIGLISAVGLGVFIYFIITKKIFTHRVENWIEEEKIQDDSGEDNLVELEKIECSKDEESISDDPSSN